MGAENTEFKKKWTELLKREILISVGNGKNISDMLKEGKEKVMKVMKIKEYNP
jgi:hypothetical protein